MPDKEKSGLSRRDFLRAAALTGAGLAATTIPDLTPIAKAAPAPPASPAETETPQAAKPPTSPTESAPPLDFTAPAEVRTEKSLDYQEQAYPRNYRLWPEILDQPQFPPSDVEGSANAHLELDPNQSARIYALNPDESISIYDTGPTAESTSSEVNFPLSFHLNQGTPQLIILQGETDDAIYREMVDFYNTLFGFDATAENTSKATLDKSFITGGIQKWDIPKTEALANTFSSPIYEPDQVQQQASETVAKREQQETPLGADQLITAKEVEGYPSLMDIHAEIPPGVSAILALEAATPEHSFVIVVDQHEQSSHGEPIELNFKTPKIQVPEGSDQPPYNVFAKGFRDDDMYRVNKIYDRFTDEPEITTFQPASFRQGKSQIAVYYTFPTPTATPEPKG